MQHLLRHLSKASGKRGHECGVSVRRGLVSSRIGQEYQPNVDGALVSKPCPAPDSGTRRRNPSTWAFVGRRFAFSPTTTMDATVVPSRPAKTRLVSRWSGIRACTGTCGCEPSHRARMRMSDQGRSRPVRRHDCDGVSYMFVVRASALWVREELQARRLAGIGQEG